MKTILIFDNDVYVRFISKMAYAKKPDIKYEEIDNAPAAMEKLKAGMHYDLVVFGFPQKDFSVDDIKTLLIEKKASFCVVDKETGPLPQEIKAAASCVFSKKLDKTEAFKKLTEALSGLKQDSFPKTEETPPVAPPPAPVVKKMEIPTPPAAEPKISPAVRISPEVQPKKKEEVPPVTAPPPAPQEKPAEIVPPAPEGDSSVIRKILIADDDDTIRELIKTILGPIYEYTDARDGAELVNRAKMNTPDLIITDIIMPGLSGYRAVGELRVDKKFFNIPAIFTSARAKDKGLFETLKPKGPCYFIPKPYDRHQFASFVKDIIAKLSITDKKNEDSGS